MLVAKAINLVEFVGSDRHGLQQQVSQVCQTLQSKSDLDRPATGYSLAQEEEDIAQLWELRKKGVGLLANTQGDRKPVPFLEDTAVPPLYLANYIQEFKALLTQYKLDYAMFGHVDVGCIHVRPALDLKVPKD